MPVLPKRVVLGGLMLAVVLTTGAVLSDDAAAQVFQGPLAFDGLSVATMTVTLQPFGPAHYRVDFGGVTIDTGILVASVSGSFVSGFIQTNVPNVRPCFFSGNLNGATANLALNASSCGGGGTLTLTRIA